MSNQESDLLMHALAYEEGHPRRTRHILSVYGLARLLGEREGLPEQFVPALHAAAILHDIAIGYCKRHGDGSADQAAQRRVAPELAGRFLESARYPREIREHATELILGHHDYAAPRDAAMQLLMEADLIAAVLEAPDERTVPPPVRSVVRSATGSMLLAAAMRRFGQPEGNDAPCGIRVSGTVSEHGHSPGEALPE